MEVIEDTQHIPAQSLMQQGYSHKVTPREDLNIAQKHAIVLVHEHFGRVHADQSADVRRGKIRADTREILQLLGVCD